MSEAWAEAAEVRRDGGVLASRDACSAAAKKTNRPLKSLFALDFRAGLGLVGPLRASVPKGERWGSVRGGGCGRFRPRFMMCAVVKG